MGNFAENLNLGNRFRPPPLLRHFEICRLSPAMLSSAIHNTDKNEQQFEGVLLMDNKLRHW